MTTTPNPDRLAELHAKCREDYAKGQSQRAVPNLAPSYAAASLRPVVEPSDLDVAIRVAQQLLDSDQVLSLREAVRLLLRALGAEPDVSHSGHVEAKRCPTAHPDAEPAAERTNGNATVADLPPATRCPAAHPEDRTPCGGPVVVTVLDAHNAGADSCEHHAARLLASLTGGRVYSLPDAPAGTAIRVFKATDTIRPFPWYDDAPRTQPSQRSHAENRARGDQ